MISEMPSPRGNNWKHSSRNGLGIWAYTRSEGPSYTVSETDIGDYQLESIGEDLRPRTFVKRFLTPMKAFQTAVADYAAYIDDSPFRGWARNASCTTENTMTDSPIESRIAAMDAAIDSLLRVSARKPQEGDKVWRTEKSTRGILNNIRIVRDEIQRVEGKNVYMVNQNAKTNEFGKGKKWLYEDEVPVKLPAKSRSASSK